MENKVTLVDFISLHIGNRVAARSFQKYCEIHCGWLPESEIGPDIDLSSFATCFENFKKEHPMVALN
jgi:hypothetical protein